MQEIIGENYAHKLRCRIAQSSQHAEGVLSGLGVSLNRENPQETIDAMILTLQAIDPVERFKIEMTVIGQNCHRHWCKVFDSKTVGAAE
jgi:hypothetical protein